MGPGLSRWWGRAQRRPDAEAPAPVPPTAALPVPTAPPAVAQPVPAMSEPSTPLPVQGQGADVTRRRRRADEQVASLQAFERRLGEQLRVAQAGGRKDVVRELLSRRLAVRARLEEALRRRDALQDIEDHLVGDPPTLPTVPAASPGRAGVGS